VPSEDATRVGCGIVSMLEAAMPDEKIYRITLDFVNVMLKKPYIRKF
jgi:hypothetical protein